MPVVVCDGAFFDRSLEETGTQKHSQCYQCSLMLRDADSYFKYEKMPIGLYKGMTYKKLLTSNTPEHKSYVRFIQRVDSATDVFRRMQLYMADEINST